MRLKGNRKILKRYLEPAVKDFLKNRMVFIGGPRQVGKTTMCLQFLKEPDIDSPAYLDWDSVVSRSKIKNAELPVDYKVLCFDEVHKYKHWRSLLKGFYDTKRNKHKFLVTGSARLDHYRKGGDSLLGRYRYLRLHPLSLSEISCFDKKSTELLLTMGGFPEPFLNGTERNLKLWHRERSYRIINDDIRDLERVKEISLVELLADAIPSRVGSPLSYKNLAEALGVHHATVKQWVQILDNVYYSFRISPFGAPRIRAVKKEQKIYLWDWSVIENSGYKFEN
ncbi:MAG: ATP-binding protein, partial [Oligoflexia bacterium]|nr:ATP-binding protein [Oligoflexia bacterium]